MLSFALIITFIFADHRYGFIATFGDSPESTSLHSAYFSACLVGLVGVASIWISWFYLTKSNAIRDMLVVCAWTRQVKTNGKWVSFETFLSEQFGYAISHGLSDTKLIELKNEVDNQWRNVAVDTASQTNDKDSLRRIEREVSSL